MLATAKFKPLPLEYQCLWTQCHYKPNRKHCPYGMRSNCHLESGNAALHDTTARIVLPQPCDAPPPYSRGVKKYITKWSTHKKLIFSEERLHQVPLAAPIQTCRRRWCYRIPWSVASDEHVAATRYPKLQACPNHSNLPFCAAHLAMPWKNKEKIVLNWFIGVAI